VIHFYIEIFLVSGSDINFFLMLYMDDIKRFSEGD